MPSLHELMEMTAERFGLDPARVALFERDLRMQWGGQRVYVTPVDSRKDPGRADRIRELARRLPTGVVAERLNVSQRYVRKLVSRPKK